MSNFILVSMLHPMDIVKLRFMSKIIVYDFCNLLGNDGKKKFNIVP